MGLLGSLIEYLYLPGGRSSIGPSGPLVPAPAATLIVLLLNVIAASAVLMLPNMILACPGFGMMPALATASGFLTTRSTLVAPSLRPSLSTAGPSGDAYVMTAFSAATTAPWVSSFQLSLPSSRR